MSNVYSTDMTPACPSFAQLSELFSQIDRGHIRRNQIQTLLASSQLLSRVGEEYVNDVAVFIPPTVSGEITITAYRLCLLDLVASLFRAFNQRLNAR